MVVPDVLDQLELGVVVHDPQTAEFVHANDTLESMYGYSLEELQERSIGELSADSFTEADAVERVRAAAEGEPQEFEWQIQRATGELLWIRVTLTRTAIDGEPYVVGHVEDITDYKVRVGRLRLLQRITRHNLRTQVQIIHGLTENLHEEIERPGLISDLDRIRSAAGDLIDLTDTINTLKTITDRAKSGREPVRLEALAADVVGDYREAHPRVAWTVDGDGDTWVAADTGLRMALEEAIQNTVDHNDERGLAVRVTVSESPENGHALLRIEDTGRPIPDLEVEAVDVDYDPDQIGHGEGTGIWAMNAIVETLGGRLSIRTGEESGNRLEFSLPQTEAPAGA